MPIVARPRPRVFSPDGERSVDALVGCRDTDALIEVGEAIARAFEQKAHAESENVMRAVFLGLADTYRRANKDAAHRWLDVSGC
jgi:hypothetical protein